MSWLFFLFSFALLLNFSLLPPLCFYATVSLDFYLVFCFAASLPIDLFRLCVNLVMLFCRHLRIDQVCDPSSKNSLNDANETVNQRHTTV
ncbi:hypothetical protein V6Z11_D13G248100 [Gossypium hirsutum]|uniref:Uncharacterized protein n=1 Tax=Gossypium tomentosum TaxID=34277 RepID=A0A5D2I1Q5_GOSTO|nr:hypothetical protein ES332_D13G256300v1 [Gossypium tomentosum]